MKVLTQIVANWIAILFVSLIDALLLLMFLNFSGITVLAALGYWQLFWLNVAVMMPVSSAVALYHASREI